MNSNTIQYLMTEWNNKLIDPYEKIDKINNNFMERLIKNLTWNVIRAEKAFVLIEANIPTIDMVDKEYGDDICDLLENGWAEKFFEREFKTNEYEWFRDDTTKSFDISIYCNDWDYFFKYLWKEYLISDKEGVLKSYQKEVEQQQLECQAFLEKFMRIENKRGE